MARILVVDDELPNRLLVRTILEYAAHEVLEAADASDAMRIAMDRGPDLAVVDLHLPGTSGVDFVNMLRRDPKTDKIKIALYTASPADAGMRDFMKSASIAYVIPKPCEPPELLRLVEAALAS